MSHITPDIDPPEEGLHIWEWFWRLSSRRQHGMNGPQPITFTEIAAWATSTGEIALREEISILLRMDDAYLASVADEQEEQRRANQQTAKGLKR